MLYNNNYPNNFNQFSANQFNANQVPNIQQPTINQPQVQTPSIQSFNNGGNFFFVNGKNEVDNWIVSPDTSVYLFDRNSSTFYIKTVEKNGMTRPLEAYRYERIDDSVDTQKEDVIDYATKDELEQLRADIRDELRKLKPITKRTTKKEVKKDE